ncbi:MAG: hypothetical protein K6T65_14665 [Peptococcaceae bacterium]|nr:hypothetical protein [Peptococcaceae bacterium]
MNDRKPDLVLNFGTWGGKVYLRNPEALPTALKNMAIKAYQLHLEGRFDFNDSTRKEDARK